MDYTIEKVELPQLNVPITQPDVYEIKRVKTVTDVSGNEVEVLDDTQTERLTLQQLQDKKARLQAEIKEIDGMLVAISKL